MSRLKWDQAGERKYETGTKKGVLYVQNGSSYNEGVVWNGLTAVTESPSGAEANDMWADNIKYGSLRSAETFGGTIEAYTYPEEFKPCNGENELIPGVSLGQQKRNPFAFSYVSDVGNDTASESDDSYKIHIIYNATASPAEKGYTTVNDSPEAITFSWEISTTPIDVPGFKPTASIEIDTGNLDEYQKLLGVLEDIENTLYGTEDTDATLMLPSDVMSTMSINIIDAEFGYDEDNPNKLVKISIPDISETQNNILKIPEGITSLEVYTVNGSEYTPYINYIEFPNSLENFEHLEISSLDGLKAIIIPDNVESIPDDQFCFIMGDNIKKVYIGSSVETIGENAIPYTGAEESLVLPDSLEYIMAGNFVSCDNLKYLKIPETLLVLGDNDGDSRGCFGNLYNLESPIIIPEAITEISHYCFTECNKVPSLTLHDGITKIGNGSFTEFNMLDQLIIPDSVEYIGGSAFGEWINATYVYIPSSVQYIGADAFQGLRHDNVRIDLTSFDSTNIPEVENGGIFRFLSNSGRFVFADQETLDAFAATSGWNNWASKFIVAE